jgi:DNA-binding XRE family transcriptional regulator
MAERSSQPPRADKASFGMLLRAHRTRLGLTQEELAERAGLSERTLRNLEGGRNPAALSEHDPAAGRCPQPDR